MLLDALAVMSLVAIAAFIVWEGWQRRRGTSKPLARAAMARGFVPGAVAAEQALFVGAAVLAVFSLMHFVSPPHPPFTGRGAVFSSLVYGVLGPLAIPVAAAGASVACFALGLSMHRRRLVAKRES
jgi:hypothetical protein